jgi:hypothetical protein
VLIVLVTAGFFRRPELTPIVMLAWCGIAVLASRVLFGGVAILVDRRRENLGIVVS